ncbi:MAG TPA: chemotaxis response regulator protein-glutamate methylesterase [Clostridia bacterium]|nr:chemotaxis response regulator protein-glutamate methylesterase [Clostridia bacterium]
MTGNTTRIKVLIIDDSALVRKMLTMELSTDESVEVVGTAPDPFAARDLIIEKDPDVLILDVEMPRMDGLTFLERIIKYHPMPVIILSSLAKSGGEVAMKALEMGAAEVLAKPGASYSISDMSIQLIDRIKAVYGIKIGNRQTARVKPVITEKTTSHALFKTTNKVIAIGASTGGTEAIREILVRLPGDMPPIVIVQHMPQYFTRSFAENLNKLSRLYVKEAENNELLAPGKVLIAPGNYHMVLKRSGASYYVEVKDGPLVYYQRPSVEVLFKSVARYAGASSVGVILTGMGRDGADGLLEMKKAGAVTIAQDESSSIVFGMPREAIQIGAADKVVNLKDIPGILVKMTV